MRLRFHIHPSNINKKRPIYYVDASYFYEDDGTEAYYVNECRRDGETLNIWHHRYALLHDKIMRMVKLVAHRTLAGYRCGEPYETVIRWHMLKDYDY